MSFIINICFPYCVEIPFQKLVVKPDQLIKRRGKLGLIKAGADLNEVKEWLSHKLGENFKVLQYMLYFPCTSSIIKLTKVRCRAWVAHSVAYGT